MRPRFRAIIPRNMQRLSGCGRALLSTTFCSSRVMMGSSLPDETGGSPHLTFRRNAVIRDWPWNKRIEAIASAKLNIEMAKLQEREVPPTRPLSDFYPERGWRGPG